MLIPLPDLVRAQLLERRGEWPNIAKQADVSHSWISKFVNKRIPNPGYATLARLNEFMSSEQKHPPALTQQAQGAINSESAEGSHA